jgi:hypothetical protein
LEERRIGRLRCGQQRLVCQQVQRVVDVVQFLVRLRQRKRLQQPVERRRDGDVLDLTGHRSTRHEASGQR